MAFSSFALACSARASRFRLNSSSAIFCYIGCSSNCRCCSSASSPCFCSRLVFASFSASISARLCFCSYSVAIVAPEATSGRDDSPGICDQSTKSGGSEICDFSSGLDISKPSPSPKVH